MVLLALLEASTAGKVQNFLQPRRTLCLLSCLNRGGLLPAMKRERAHVTAPSKRAATLSSRVSMFDIVLQYSLRGEDHFSRSLSLHCASPTSPGCTVQACSKQTLVQVTGAQYLAFIHSLPSMPRRRTSASSGSSSVDGGRTAPAQSHTCTLRQNGAQVRLT